MQFYLPYNSYYPLFYNISARVLAILIILLFQVDGKSFFLFFTQRYFQCTHNFCYIILLAFTEDFMQLSVLLIIWWVIRWFSYNNEYLSLQIEYIPGYYILYLLGFLASYRIMRYTIRCIWFSCFNIHFR